MPCAVPLVVTGLQAAQAEVAHALQEGLPARMIKSLQKKEAAAQAALKAATEKSRVTQQASGGADGARSGLARALALADEWASSGVVLFVTVDTEVAAVFHQDHTAGSRPTRHQHVARRCCRRQLRTTGWPPDGMCTCCRPCPRR